MDRLLLLDRMRDAPALRELPLPELDRLLAGSELRRFRAGEPLVEEGTPAAEVYLLLEGRVCVRKRLGAGEKPVIALRHPVDWIGETALLDEAVRSATVTAEESVRALRIPREAFQRLVASCPAVAMDLLRLVSARLRESDASLIAMLDGKNRELVARNRRLARENRRLRSALRDESGFEGFLGQSIGAQRVRAAAQQAADSDLPVLLLGETGTGKELLARAIHAASSRADGPFVALNCALLRDTLIESELFGHARGAFTGALAAKSGLVEAADGGTLLLDEVADMPLAVQGALLRFLELGEFRRLGETQLRHAEVRAIAATHRDLEAAVRSGAFRRDLLYRLDVIRIEIPPLRERPDDLPALIAHVARRVSARQGVPALELGESALAALCSYEFPGNVRELENEIERASALRTVAGPIPLEALSPRIAIAGRAVAEESYADVVRGFKARLVERALAEAGGNRTRAAERLGVHRSNLVRMIRELGLEPGNA